MHTLSKSTYVLAVGLSALAGCVDAIGFLQLGGYFISFMSGNSTRLSVHLIEGDMAKATLLASILLLFVLGVIGGTLARHFSHPPRATTNVLGLVTVLLSGAALCDDSGFTLIAIICMTLAMGVENAVFQRNGDVVVGLTYMTGTLVKVGQRIASALLGGPKFAWAPYLLLWLGLILGGMVGMLLFSFFGLQGLWFAVVWAAGLTIATILQRHRLSI